MKFLKSNLKSLWISNLKIASISKHSLSAHKHIFMIQSVKMSLNVTTCPPGKYWCYFMHFIKYLNCLWSMFSGGLFVCHICLLFWNKFYVNIKCTRGIHSFVVFYWSLRWITKSTYFASVAPEAIISWILLLYKLVIVNVCGKVGMRLCAITVFSNLSKGASKFIFTCFSWDIATVTWYLCSWIRLTHDDNIYNFQWCL